jgi:Tol biopolymer transport system component
VRRALVAAALVVAAIAAPVGASGRCETLHPDLLLAPMASSPVIVSVDRTGCGSRVVVNAADEAPALPLSGAFVTTPSRLGRHGAFVYGWTYGNNLAGHLRSELRVASAPGRPSSTLLQVPLAGMVEDVAGSPDGKRIAFTLFTWAYPVTVATWTAAGSQSRIWVVNADGTGLRPVSALSTGLDTDPVWSPDSRKLAWTSERGLGTVVVSDLSLGALGTAVSPLGLDAGWPRWSPDGRDIAFVAYDLQEALSYPPDLWLVHPDGTGGRRLLVGADQPSWSPDSRYLVVIRGSFVAVVDRRTGRARLVPGTERCYFPAWSRDGKQLAFACAGQHQYSDAVYAARPDGRGSVRLTETEYGIPVW